MASSWNKATAVEQTTDTPTPKAAATPPTPAAPVNTGPSLWETTINAAAEAMSSGAAAVADAAEVTWDALPTMADVTDAASGVVETAKSLGDFGTAEYRAYVNNFINAGGTFTEKDLNAVDIETLKAAVTNAKREGRKYIDYKDFGTTEEEVNKLSTFAGLFDPNIRMARTVGGTKFKTDKGGNIIIENKYNFNAGPKRLAYMEALKNGDTVKRLELLTSSTPVEAASILAYATQEKSRELGGPTSTLLTFNLGKF